FSASPLAVVFFVTFVVAGGTDSVDMDGLS
ncbi:hypothetical protein MGSAQ_002011, partial [marine sediment metagenome]